MSRYQVKIVLALVAGLLLMSSPVEAKVTSGGKVIPDPAVGCYGGKPGGLAAIFACACTQSGVCNIGKPCPGGSSSCDSGQNGTCETTIWHKVNGDPCIPANISGLDPVADAAIKPETFKPVCGHTFTLLTRGDALFQNGFGWYNAVPGQKPAQSDLHVLVDCNTKPGTKTTFDLMTDPNYKGGQIGFFLVTPESNSQGGTCAGGDCCATVSRAVKGEGRIYYSESAYNPDKNYIHLLLYNSKIDPHMFYFAWEDTFEGKTTDYSDFVTSVSGISCAGAGEQCSTTKPGVCGRGVTKCTIEGKVVCEESIKPSAETCDGLDNDCNGLVDDGATCPDGKQCYQGLCIGKCTQSSEFPCQIGYTCDKQSGLCVDQQCKGVTCKAGEVCRNGKCGNGCEGVTCPRGQFCSAGLCVDPCAASSSCPGTQVCVLGVCMPNCSQCGGLTCAKGMACDKQSGECFDDSCGPAGSCGVGMYCKGGKCVDDCDGVICPGNVACKDGACPPPGIGSTLPKTDMGGVQLDGSAPWVPDGGSSGDGGVSGDTGKAFYVKDGGCSLAAGTPGGASPFGSALPLALLLALLALRRRDR
jgi:MYXO-CTERM domain-containing protein